MLNRSSLYLAWIDSGLVRYLRQIFFGYGSEEWAGATSAAGAVAAGCKPGRSRPLLTRDMTLLPDYLPSFQQLSSLSLDPNGEPSLERAIRYVECGDSCNEEARL